MEHETRATILTKEDLSAKAVFDAVKEGDEVAIEVATEMGNYLGHAMADMAAVLDPAVFVIGGGVSKAGEVLLSFIEKPFMEKAFFANKNVNKKRRFLQMLDICEIPSFFFEKFIMQALS